MNSYKMSVELKDIDPGNNPRKDFGDIDALAATIEATGGQPVNPIIVVRDGSRFRLVDGERRYRALVKLYGMGGVTDALCFADYGEAQEAVAMLATDDKMQLSEAERARGFQQMMILGVESRTIAKAMHRKTSEIAAARAVARQAPAQATIDQMICAAELDDEDDRKAVLAAEPDKYRAKAEAIKRRRKEEYEAKELHDCIMELGFDPLEKQPAGYRQLMWASTADEMRALVDKYDECELAVWPVPWNKNYWYLGAKDERKRQDAEEERKRRELAERRDAATKTLRRGLVQFVAKRWETLPEHLAATCGRLREDVLGKYSYDKFPKDLGRYDVEEDVADAARNAPMSAYELLSAIAADYSISWVTLATDVLEAAMDDGYSEIDEERWLWQLATRARNDSKDEVD